MQWASYASIDYDIYLDSWHFKLHLKTDFKLKTNSNFQILKHFTESLWNKGQSSIKTDRNDENNCFIGFLRGQFLDSKARTRGIALIFWKLFENSYAVDTHQKIQWKKPVIFVKKVKLVKVV